MAHLGYINKYRITIHTVRKGTRRFMWLRGFIV